MPEDTRHSSFFFTYFGTRRSVPVLIAAAVFSHYLLLYLFPGTRFISDLAWTLIILFTFTASCSAFRHVRFTFLKRAWFFIIAASMLLFVLYAHRTILSIMDMENDSSFFSAAMMSLGLGSIAVSFLFFSQSQNSGYKIIRYMNLVAIILVTLFTLTYVFNFQEFHSNRDFFQTTVYILNANSSIFVFIIGACLYLMSIWRKEKKRQVVYLVILSTVGLAYAALNFWYMPRLIRGEPMTGGLVDPLASAVFMLPVLAAWAECCYKTESTGEINKQTFNFFYVSRVERIIPGLSLFLIVISIMTTDTGFRELFYNSGLVILLILSVLLVTFEWISYRSEDALIAILSFSPVAVQITDRQMKNSFFINSRMFELYGEDEIPADKIITSAVSDFVRKDIAASVLNGNGIESIETGFTRSDGTAFTAQCRIIPTKYYSHRIVIIWMNDTTERTDYEAELASERDKAEYISRYNETMLSNLSEKMLSGYIVGTYMDIDGTADFMFREMNRQALEILNSPVDLTGRRYREVFPDPTAAILESVCESWRTGVSKRIEVYSVNLAKHLLIVIFKTGYDEVAIVLNDITERKNAELSMRENEEKIRQAEKVRDISQMAGGIAHDLNNKLMGISSYMTLIDMKLSDPAVKRYTTGIHSIIKESADLIDSVLTFARRLNVARTDINIHSLLYELFEELSSSIRNNITMSSGFNAMRCTVSGDRAMLRRALYSIMENSVDAITSSGIITVWTENTGPEEDRFIRETAPEAADEYILIIVSDTGKGIQKDILPRIFDPFFTTKPVGKGKGLGLSSVFGAIQSHGGFIRVNSIENEGTEFMIYLPCSGGQDPAVSISG